MWIIESFTGRLRGARDTPGIIVAQLANNIGLWASADYTTDVVGDGEREIVPAARPARHLVKRGRTQDARRPGRSKARAAAIRHASLVLPRKKSSTSLAQKKASAKKTFKGLRRERTRD